MTPNLNSPMYILAAIILFCQNFLSLIDIKTFFYQYCMPLNDDYIFFSMSYFPLNGFSAFEYIQTRSHDKNC